MRRVALIFLIFIIVLVVGFGIYLSLGSGGGDLSKVSGLKLKETTVYLGLSWEPVEGAGFYQVYRDDGLIAETDGLYYNDSDAEVGVSNQYRVCAGKRIFLSTLCGESSEAVWGNLTPIIHNDSGFRAFSMDTYDLIMGMGHDFEEVGKAMDLEMIKSLSLKLEGLCYDFLQESYAFEISIDLRPANDEYRLAMEDLITGCQLVQEGVDHLDQGKAFEGIDYVTLGVEHLQDSIDLLSV